MPPLFHSRARRAPCANLAAALVAVTFANSACSGSTTRIPPPTSRATMEPRPEKPTPEAVWVQLQAEDPEQHWSLVASDQKPLCELPCARWIAPGGGTVLQYERPGMISVLQVSLPDQLGPAGSSVVAIAHPGHQRRRTSTQLIVGGVSLAVLGVIAYPFLANRGGDSSTIALVLAVSLGVPVVGAGLYLRATEHPAEVSLRSASTSPSPTFTLGPGFLEASSASPLGFHLILSPLGAFGTF